MAEESPNREDRFSEIGRKYVEATKQEPREALTIITKPTDLESYREERKFFGKQRDQEPKANATTQSELPFRAQEAVINQQATREAAWASASSGSMQTERRDEQASVQRTLSV